MIVEQIEYTNNDLKCFKDDLLGKLKGNIFHLTPRESFEKIKKDGIVYHNKDGKFPMNPSSKNSFGRKRGWVCLFDLRKQSQKTIEEISDKYFFLKPRWFNDLNKKYEEANLAYLLVHPDEYNKIVPNDTAKKAWMETGYEHYIPKGECWYPENMPLTCIEKVLLVRIYNDAPKYGSSGYWSYQFRLDDQKAN